jgi:ferritin-like metal-binding protein YciE
MVWLAKTLGYNDAAEILNKTLMEEKEADRKLTQIAENNINYQASHELKREKSGIFS